MPQSTRQGFRSMPIQTVQVPFPQELLKQVDGFKHTRQNALADSRKIFTREDRQRIEESARRSTKVAREELEQLHREKLANHVNDGRISRNVIILALIAEGLKTLSAVPERYTFEQVAALIK